MLPRAMPARPSLDFWANSHKWIILEVFYAKKVFELRIDLFESASNMRNPDKCFGR